MYNEVFAELHKPMSASKGPGGPPKGHNEPSHGGASGYHSHNSGMHHLAGPNDHHHPAADENQHDHHDGMDTHSQYYSRRIIVNAQFSVPLTIEHSLSLENESSARYMLYAIRIAKIFGNGFRNIDRQLGLVFKNMNVIFKDHALDHDQKEHRVRRSDDHTVSHVHVHVFYEKDVHEDEEISKVIFKLIIMQKQDLV